MKIIIKNILYAAVLALTLGACSDSEFEKINTDPNRPANVPTPSIILAAQKQLVDNIRNENFSLRGTQLFAQYYSQNIYTDQSRYDIPRSYADDYWADAYKALNNLNKVIKLNTDDDTKAIASAGTAGTNANQIAISRVLKAFTFHSLTDAFGDIPYESHGNDDPDFEATLTRGIDRSPFEQSRDSEIATVVRDAATTVVGVQPAFAGEAGWMDSALLSAAGIPTVIFGPDGAGAHADVEWVDLVSLEQCRQIYVATARAFCR